MIEIRSGLCVMGGLTGKGLQEVFWVMKIFFFLVWVVVIEKLGTCSLDWKLPWLTLMWLLSSKLPRLSAFAFVFDVTHGHVTCLYLKQMWYLGHGPELEGSGASLLLTFGRI